MGGGSVDTLTGEFNFAVLEGYLIKNGKIDSPVRGATLIGKGSEKMCIRDRLACNPDSIEVFSDMALIATVGHGMIRRVGISAKLFSALADAGVNVRLIDQGSSELNIIVGVQNDDFEVAMRAIYASLTKEG